MSSCIKQHLLVECPASVECDQGERIETRPDVYFDTAQYGVETKEAVGLLGRTENSKIHAMGNNTLEDNVNELELGT